MPCGCGSRPLVGSGAHAAGTRVAYANPRMARMTRTERQLMATFESLDHDPLLDAWRTAAPLPTRRFAPCAAPAAAPLLARRFAPLAALAAAPLRARRAPGPCLPATCLPPAGSLTKLEFPPP